MTVRTDAARLVTEMTLEEKASLCSGRDFWTTKAIWRLGVPALTVTDGPHGVRLQRSDRDELGLREAEPATCFPTASALAATWDRELIGDVGRAIADECLALGVDVLLGPGVNLKRSPLCGRNFEYFSEDPLLTGELAAAFVEAVQSRGVGTSLKHFAANNQESRRMTIDAVVDERTLRELELASFERVVRLAAPWTVMCSYNRLNGTYACENEWLLGQVLRDEWGYEGLVVTDWGAMNDRVAALAAGCDLEMPGPSESSDTLLVEAVTSGHLALADLDVAAGRAVTLAQRAEASRRTDATVDHDAHHRLARRAAAAAAVLCRNVGRALPITDDDDVAVLGPFAGTPRYQGTGSSRVTPTRLDSLVDELTELLGRDRVTHAPGVQDPGRRSDERIAAAVDVARRADVAVVCVGLPEGWENEGDDRTSLRLPPAHDALVAAVAAAHPRVVVVLSNGAPVEMPWVEDVEAVVEGYLGGQAGGGGLADVLTGVVDPSGRLAETFPRHLDDVPSTRNFPGGPSTVEYREGLYVGYRFHDTVDGEVLFPFGHGLSYTSFALGEVALDRATIPVDELADTEVAVAVRVTNTGEVAGSTVVQVYVADVEAAVHRPVRELKAFTRVTLEPGASKRVVLGLDRRAFAYWHPDLGAWTVEPGVFEVAVGESSRDLRGRASLEVIGAPLLPRREEPDVLRQPGRYLDVDGRAFETMLGRARPDNPDIGPPYTRNTPIAAIATSPQGRALVWVVERRLRQQFAGEASSEALVRSMLEEAPLRTLLMGGMTAEELDSLIELLNGRWVSGGDRLVRSLWQRRPSG